MKKCLLTLALLATASSFAMAENYDNGIAHKVELRVDAGGGYGRNKDKAILIDAGLGYNFSSNFYLGIASGIYPDYGICDGAKPGTYLPLLGDITLKLNDNTNDEWSFFLSLKGGLLKNLKGDGVLDDGTPYTFRNYTYFELAPGYCWRPNRSLDLRFSIGGGIGLPGKDGFDPKRTPTHAMFFAKIGLGIRGKAKTGTRREIRQHELEEATLKQKAELEEIQQAQAKAQKEAEERAEAERKARREKREADARAAAEAAAGIR